MGVGTAIPPKIRSARSSISFPIGLPAPTRRTRHTSAIHPRLDLRIGPSAGYGEGYLFVRARAED
jgi:hypothetical protein